MNHLSSLGDALPLRYAQRENISPRPLKKGVATSMLRHSSTSILGNELLTQWRTSNEGFELFEIEREQRCAKAVGSAEPTGVPHRSQNQLATATE